MGNSRNQEIDNNEILFEEKRKNIKIKIGFTLSM